jgi:hypothetical protein
MQKAHIISLKKVSQLMCKKEVDVHTLIQQHQQQNTTNNHNNDTARNGMSFYSQNHIKHKYYVRKKRRCKMAYVGYIVVNYG